MEKRADGDTVHRKLFSQLGSRPDNLLAKHDGGFIYIHRVLEESALAGEMELGRCRGLEKTDLFQLGDNLVHAFSASSGESLYELFFVHFFINLKCKD